MRECVVKKECERKMRVRDLFGVVDSQHFSQSKSQRVSYRLNLCVRHVAGESAPFSPPTSHSVIVSSLSVFITQLTFPVPLDISNGSYDGARSGVI